VNRGLFPKGFISLDPLSINTVIIEKGKTKLVSFSNPVRVTKTRLDKESHYSTTY
jgi:hypothetical protein